MQMHSSNYFCFCISTEVAQGFVSLTGLPGMDFSSYELMYKHSELHALQAWRFHCRDLSTLSYMRRREQHE